MLWNWYTIDSCFLSSSWHVRSAGTFAGTCIGVMFLVIALEFLRRLQREFDRHLLQGSRPALSSRGRQSSDEEGSSPSGSGQSKQGTKITILPKFSVASGSQPKLWQHLVRSFLYMLQFAVGYFVMLLAMYYNGKMDSEISRRHSSDPSRIQNIRPISPSPACQSEAWFWSAPMKESLAGCRYPSLSE
ncbi:MAG: hypothetical protein M1825_000279 [Sarcosagium campestre]|nr:MAG: hypothetical protein M1825_000279 [Sarcosagium campestre]